MERRNLQKLIWIVPILAVQLSILPVAAQKKLPHNFGDRFAAIAYSPSDGRWGIHTNITQKPGQTAPHLVIAEIQAEDLAKYLSE